MKNLYDENLDLKNSPERINSAGYSGGTRSRTKFQSGKSTPLKFNRTVNKYDIYDKTS